MKSPFLLRIIIIRLKGIRILVIITYSGRAVEIHRVRILLTFWSL